MFANCIVVKCSVFGWMWRMKTCEDGLNEKSVQFIVNSLKTVNNQILVYAWKPYKILIHHDFGSHGNRSV